MASRAATHGALLLWCGAIVVACNDLSAPNAPRLPVCATGVDPDDLEGSARRLGCDPDLVVKSWPTPGSMVDEPRPEVGVELAQPMREPAQGRGCDGPIRLARLGRVNEVPEDTAADIVSHASITTLPLWPREDDCVAARWRIDDHSVSLVPDQPLERFVWYQVTLPRELPIAGARLCSGLAWRFTVRPCGDGAMDVAESFVDWVCLGHVEAERGWFQPYEETCDDGNRKSYDGCSETCVHETGWTCDEEGCHTRCGDGIRTKNEECDYGVNPPPGCDAQCRIEPGYTCDWYGCTPDDAGVP